MSRRRRRIRTKHYERMMMILIVAGVGLIGWSVLMRRPAQTVQRGLASVAAARYASRVAGAKNKLKAALYLEHIRETLGNSDAGKLAYKIFLRNLAPEAAAQDWTVRKLCISDAFCPIKVAQVYSFALKRLNPVQDAYARLGFQAQLLESQINNQTKLSILQMALNSTANSTSSQIKSHAPTLSVVAKNGKVQLAPPTEYEVLTIAQYEKLQPQAGQFINTVLQVAKNSRDTVGRKFILQTLYKAYPKFHKDIVAQASRLGMTIASR